MHAWISTETLSRYPLPGEVVAQAFSESDWAEQRRREGQRVVESRGRFWHEVFPGFYETLPALVRMTSHEASRPTWRSWGFKATLRDCDSDAANGFMPVWLIADLENHGEHSVHRQKRKQLRKCLQTVTIVRLTDPFVLHTHGYGVYLSYAARLGVRHPLSDEGYRRVVSQWFEDPRRLVVAGVLGGRLLGYQEGYAVGSTAYLYRLHVSTEGLSSGVSFALNYQALDLWRRSGMREATCGIYQPENPGLTVFKRHSGFEVVKMPVRFHAPRLVRAYIKRRQPNTYFRLTGDHTGIAGYADAD